MELHYKARMGGLGQLVYCKVVVVVVVALVRLGLIQTLLVVLVVMDCKLTSLVHPLITLVEEEGGGIAMYILHQVALAVVAKAVLRKVVLPVLMVTLALLELEVVAVVGRTMVAKVGLA